MASGLLQTHPSLLASYCGQKTTDDLCLTFSALSVSSGACSAWPASISLQFILIPRCILQSIHVITFNELGV